MDEANLGGLPLDDDMRIGQPWRGGPSDNCSEREIFQASFRHWIEWSCLTQLTVTFPL